MTIVNQACMKLPTLEPSHEWVIAGGVISYHT